MTIRPTESPQTQSPTPRISPADGPGAAEESTYETEAAAMAESLFEGLAEGFDESSGVETPSAQVGEAGVETGGSPTTTPSELTPPSEQTQTAQPAQAEAPAQAQPAVQTPPQTPATPEQVAAQQTAQQTPDPAATPAMTPTGEPQSGVGYIQSLRQALDTGRETYTKALAEHYAMSEDEASAVLTEPEKVLPQLAARVHLEVVQNVLGTLAGVLPGVIHGVQQAQVQHKEVENQFFEQWPQLDRKTDYGAVMELAGAWRRANPNAAVGDMIKNVGAMAIVKLGKLPAAAPAAPVPAAPGAYRPAVGAPSPVQPAQTPDNPWAGMSELLDE